MSTVRLKSATKDYHSLFKYIHYHEYYFTISAQQRLFEHKSELILLQVLYLLKNGALAKEVKMIIDRIQLFFIIIDHYTINNNMVNYLLRYSVILIIGYNNNGLQAKRYGLMRD